MNRKRHLPPPPRGLLAQWTVQRAAMTGFCFGLAAIALAAFASSRTGLLVYAGLLVLTILCGASILLISLHDARARERGESVRPIRMFDLAMGSLLVLPASIALYRVWPLLAL